MDEVVKGVRRDQLVRAEMKGGRDPGGDVAGHGPVGPGEGGPREKANHWTRMIGGPDGPTRSVVKAHAVW